MKKILLSAALVVAFASCSREVCDVDTPSDGVLQTISVTVEQFGEQTKTAISTDGTSTWSQGDQIGIYPVATSLGSGQTSQQIVFNVVNPSQSASGATFTGTGWGLVTNGNYKYFAYYPYSTSALYNEVTVSYNYSLIQSANNSTAHLGCNDYLYAPQIQPQSSSEASFTFKHLSALVEFEITVPDTVWTRAFTRLEVEAPTALFTTAGTYDPSSATTSAAPAITSSETTKKLTLSLNGSTGIVPDGSGKLHLYFLIAPAAVSGKTLSVKVIDINNYVYTCTKTPEYDIPSQGNKTYECTVAPKPMTEATDLSQYATANCYIVPEYGKYMFRANVKGNGVVPTGMTESSALDMTGCTAEVIWETVNTDTAPNVGAIVSSASIEGNYIIFDATGTQGNALIALKNGNDILWSWHIWSTSASLADSTQTYGGADMMDRNLGALTATRGNGLTLGFHYQWGRPCPITGGCSTSTGAFSSARMATTNSSVWVEEETTSTKGTLAYSAAHPTSFIYASASNYFKGQTSGNVSKNWLWTADATTGYATAADMPALWGSAKTMYDPCPVGWKVPAGGNTGVWSAAGFSSTTFTFNSTYKGRTFTSPALYYPAAGQRGSAETAQSGGLGSVGIGVVYWSSSVYESYGYALYFNSGYSSPSGLAPRALGFSVRPCQE